MNVLSLFDGISCGQLALKKANKKYDNYYSSEIDRNCLRVTYSHFPKTKQLGDVVGIQGKQLPKIDLLIGGSPCTGFSLAGKQLNFNDPQSALFFEYVRILNECNPIFFLLENVKMKKEYQDVITRHLGVNPIEINSSAFSVQNRKRLYWTNIPIDKFKETEEKFNKYLYRLGHGYIKDEVKFFEKYPALAAQSPGTKYRIIEDIDKINNVTYEQIRNDNSISRVATPEECEYFQTLPIGYTSILNKTNRYKCIGNGWTVEVIRHIFKNLT